MKQHPPEETFPNSTILEALCELHFNSGDNASNEAWNGKWFGRLLTELGPEYDMEPKLVTGVQIQTSGVGQSTISSKPVDTGHMIYRHKDDSHLIQLTPWKLTINEIGKYEGWTVFSQHIQNTWNCLLKMIDPIRLHRIGMRYINKIPRTSSEESVSNWIKDIGLVPKDILEQKMNFFYRCELQKSSEMKLLLTLAEDKTSTPSSLIFDIDMVKVNDFEPKWNALASELDIIHKSIRTVFDSSRTDTYTNFLKAK